MVKQSASDKRVITCPLTSYELDFWSDYVSIEKLKAKKFGVDWLIFVAIAREKPGGGGFHLPPPPAEIGLMPIFQTGKTVLHQGNENMVSRWNYVCTRV